MKKYFIFFVFGIIFQTLLAQNNIPQGWKFGGALPAFSYDTDVGIRYGGIAYIYDWGDGSLYPDYLRSIYLEASWTTKGSNIYRINYDDKAFLGSNVRFLGELGYYVDKALDFYGFNGYQAVFNQSWMTTADPNYKSRMFYRQERNLFRVSLDFQIPLNKNKIRAFAGFNFFGLILNSVDINKLNKGKDPDEMLPSLDSVPGIYELYQQWKILPESEIHGGNVGVLKAGLIYDTRDNEAMPTKGLWDEIIIIGGMPFNTKQPYLQLVLTHRQYFTLLPKHLFFAYRLVYSSKIAGTMPFYMFPFYFNTKEIVPGFGGSKTIRGIYRSRLVADGIFFENSELRWRITDFSAIGQNFYVALSAFIDGAVITKPYDFNTTNIPADILNSNEYFNFSQQELNKFHLGYGGGFRIAMNENFIVAIDYGLANDKQDGSSGLYIGLGWLF